VNYSAPLLTGGIFGIQRQVANCSPILLSLVCSVLMKITKHMKTKISYLIFSTNSAGETVYPLAKECYIQHFLQK
jgi:hypothetical protein